MKTLWYTPGEHNAGDRLPGNILCVQYNQIARIPAPVINKAEKPSFIFTGAISRGNQSEFARGAAWKLPHRTLTVPHVVSDKALVTPGHDICRVSDGVDNGMGQARMPVIHAGELDGKIVDGLL